MLPKIGMNADCTACWNSLSLWLYFQSWQTWLLPLYICFQAVAGPRVQSQAVAVFCFSLSSLRQVFSCQIIDHTRRHVST